MEVSSVAVVCPQLISLAAFLVSLPQGHTTNLLMSLRWVHFIAGIAWVGFLYFFVLVTGPVSRQLDPAVRLRAMPAVLSRALWWFRWASVLTVFVGIWYWMKIVTTDRENAPGFGFESASSGTAIGSFFGIWTVAFVIYMGILMMTWKSRNAGLIVGVTAAIIVAAASYGYVALNSQGWESNRLISIGVGGGMGWFMMFNVWGVIWRMQKRLLKWSAEAANGTPMPAQAEKFTRITQLASRTNFWLSFPMLFFMAAASHYPMFVTS